jgi:hypothetical protein
MTAIKTTLAGRTADPQVKPLGALDESGTGAGPYHMTKAVVDSSGALVDPAREQTLSAVNATLSAALGAPGDSVWSAGAGSLIALSKAIVGAFAKVDALHADNGVGATGVFAPAGGSGSAGWLSGIYQKLSGALIVQWSGQSVATIESASSITTNQVSVGASATPIVAARMGRKSLTLINLGATDVFVGASSVATATGVLLIGAKGGGLVIDGGAAVYGIVASGTQTIAYMEAY